MSATMHKWMTKKSGGGADPLVNAPAPVVGDGAGAGNVLALSRPSPQACAPNGQGMGVGVWPHGPLPIIISDDGVLQLSPPPHAVSLVLRGSEHSVP